MMFRCFITKMDNSCENIAKDVTTEETESLNHQDLDDGKRNFYTCQTSLPVKRRHSTGTFISDTERNSCKDDATYHSQKYDGQRRTFSRQYSHENIIPNFEAVKCSRFHSRRNALCDPLRLLLPQYRREQLEQEVEKRKNSVTRKVSQFITVSLDLNREEELF